MYAQLKLAIEHIDTQGDTVNLDEGEIALNIESKTTDMEIDKDGSQSDLSTNEIVGDF